MATHCHFYLITDLLVYRKVLHPIDSASVTLIALGMMLMPKIGVITWKGVEKKIPWGTIIVFGVGISLGNVLLKTGAAQWLSDKTFGLMGLKGYQLSQRLHSLHYSIF